MATDLRRLVSLRLACLAACLPLCVPVLASAEDGAPKVRVSATVTSTSRTAGESGHASTGIHLEVGQQKAGYLFSSEDCSANGASGDATMPPEFQGHAVPAFTMRWALEAKLLSSAIDRAVFELGWQRADLRGGVPPLGDRRTLTLRYGDRHVLDFHPCPVDSKLANEIVEVTVSPLEDEFVAPYSSEIWLVHQGADGRKTTRKATVVGRQGEKVSFRFEPVPLPIEAGASESRLNLDVSGAVTLRERQDGTIELALETTRALRNPVSGGSERGTKLLTVKEGEAVEVVLPARGGTGQWRLRDDEPRPKNLLPGVSVADGVVAIDAPRFWEGIRTSIIVTVRRTK